MLSVLCSDQPLVRDAFVNVLHLERLEETPLAIIYRRNEWIYIHLKTAFVLDHLSFIVSNYLPERIYFPTFGYSIDLIHEVGDIIAPNVIFTYDEALETADVTKDDRETYAREVRYLETYAEQKDYYVEDYGLSIGGIITDTAPEYTPELPTDRLTLAYEADIYTEDDLSARVSAVEADEAPALLLAGVISGKPHPKFAHEDPLLLTAKNMVTTIRLLQDDENEETPA